MTILVLVRNFVPAHEQIAAGGWDVAAVAKNEYDLEDKVVGTVGVGEQYRFTNLLTVADPSRSHWRTRPAPS